MPPVVCSFARGAAASRSIRQLTLIHGVLAFAFNIAVLAPTINIFASVV
jgi:uncharacterized membrane protein